jgi:hypothetical protein
VIRRAVLVVIFLNLAITPDGYPSLSSVVDPKIAAIR